MLYPAVSATLVKEMAAVDFVKACAWRMFIFAMLSTLGAIVTELVLPEISR